MIIRPSRAARVKHMFRANVYVKTRPFVRSFGRRRRRADALDVDLAFNAPRENDRVRRE